MNIFGRFSGLRAAVLIGLVTAAAIFIAVLLDIALPGSERARNIFGVIQSFVTAIAIVIGGIWAYSRFQAFRTLQPHLYIRHRVTHRSLSESYLHIELTAVVHNTSRVHVELERGVAIVQEVAPISNAEAEALFEAALGDDADPWIPWPIIGRMQRVWENPSLIVEPGATHSETFEFIVLKWEDQSLLLYTYFYNAEAQRHPEMNDGWSATTVYDVFGMRSGSRGQDVADGEDR